MKYLLSLFQTAVNCINTAFADFRKGCCYVVVGCGEQMTNVVAGGGHFVLTSLATVSQTRSSAIADKPRDAVL